MSNDELINYGADIKIGNGRDIIPIRPSSPNATVKPRTILQARGCPQGAETVTIAVGLDYDPDDRPDLGDERRAFVIGKLEFGVGGASQTLYFDWRNGTELSFPANFAKVSAWFQEMALDPGIVPAAVGETSVQQLILVNETYQNFRGTVSLSHGGRGDGALVTRTYPRCTIPNQAVANPGISFQVPPFANSFLLYSAEADLSGLAVEFRGAPATESGLVIHSMAAPNVNPGAAASTIGYQGVLIPGGVRWVNLLNTGAGNLVVYPCFILNV